MGLSEKQQQQLSTLLRLALVSYSHVELHHGDCAGADAQAHDLAVHLCLHRIVIHPPANSSLRAHKRGHASLEPAPYLVRNRAIVDACEHLIACPGAAPLALPQPSGYGGTWYTIGYAREQRRQLTIIYPDGRLETA